MGFSLGKLPKKVDERNLQFTNYIRKVIPPSAFNFEREVLKREDYPLLDQGSLPACTVYSAATGQLRFEWSEQKELVSFSHDELSLKYRMIEQPGGGAYLLDLNSLWRREGLLGCTRVRAESDCWIQEIIAKRKKRCIPYKIDGYQEVRVAKDDLKLASYVFGILEIGILVTEGFVKSYPRMVPVEAAFQSVLGGHAMSMIGYTPEGIIVRHTWKGHLWPQIISWGYCLAMTKEWRTTMLDEAYGMVDSKNPRQLRMLDLAKFFSDLEGITC